MSRGVSSRHPQRGATVTDPISIPGQDPISIPGQDPVVIPGQDAPEPGAPAEEPAPASLPEIAPSPGQEF
jgi:hypothetical protein